MTLAGLSPAGALIVRAGEPFALQVGYSEENGDLSDLTGRTFALAIRYTDQTQPILVIDAELDALARTAVALGTAEQASQIYVAGLTRRLSYDFMEVTGGATSSRLTERVAVEPGSNIAGNVVPQYMDVPLLNVTVAAQRKIVTERGRPGFGAERRLYDAGIIDEPTLEKMDQRYLAAGAESARPFKEAAEAARDAAVGSATFAGDRADVAEDAAARAVVTEGNLATTYLNWSGAQRKLATGSIADPDSFDKLGGKVGPGGYYKLALADGQEILLPSEERVRADVAAAIDTAITPQKCGALADGSRRTIADMLNSPEAPRRYTNLADVKADYPHATALTDPWDWLCIQAAINTGDDVAFRSGDYWVGEKQIISTIAGQSFYGMSGLGASANEPAVGGAFIRWSPPANNTSQPCWHVRTSRQRFVGMKFCGDENSPDNVAIMVQKSGNSDDIDVSFLMNQFYDVYTGIKCYGRGLLADLNQFSHAKSGFAIISDWPQTGVEGSEGEIDPRYAGRALRITRNRLHASGTLLNIRNYIARSACVSLNHMDFGNQLMVVDTDFAEGGWRHGDMTGNIADLCGKTIIVFNPGTRCIGLNVNGGSLGGATTATVDGAAKRPAAILELDGCVEIDGVTLNDVNLHDTSANVIQINNSEGRDEIVAKNVGIKGGTIRGIGQSGSARSLITSVFDIDGLVIDPASVSAPGPSFIALARSVGPKTFSSISLGAACAMSAFRTFSTVNIAGVVEGVEKLADGYLRHYMGSATLFDQNGGASPEGVVSAGPASTFRDVVSGHTYTKTNGTGPTGWKVDPQSGANSDITSMTGLTTITVSHPTGAAISYIDSLSGQFALLRFRSAGVNCWDVGKNAEPRAGGGSGDNWTMRRADDAGTLVTTQKVIRSNGEFSNAGNILPMTDNAHTLGASAYRFTVAYVSTGAINTSDERSKRDIGTITDELLDAWAAVEWKAYRFNDAYAAKGDDARWHFGAVAQQVRDAIDARLGTGAAIRLGLVCYDEWDEQPEIRLPVMARREVEDETGQLITEDYETGETYIDTPYRAAGNLWGLRYDECLVVEAAFQRRRLDRIEAMIAATGSADVQGATAQ
ncbi:tail fiber domain-containing protein [Sphingobium sp. Z007]|uniref:tail fiber domain-containing protein n=1 Tax=Sphingobium sp. Z007 TaxID=627495 RepID=UPI000B49FF90|nr:tail fiber domain-containing protein [Sphingobium sp. Z007]